MDFSDGHNPLNPQMGSLDLSLDRSSLIAFTSISTTGLDISLSRHSFEGFLGFTPFFDSSIRFYISSSENDQETDPDRAS
jgi:hypothetical protein